MPTTALGRLRRPAYLAIPLLDGESTDCLASMDASVVVVGRNRSKGEAAVAEIKARSGNEAVELMMADLTSQAEIHRLAKEFEAHYDRLDVLVNNAGAKYAKRWEAAEGIEGTLAIIHLAPFYRQAYCSRCFIGVHRPGS